MASSSEFMASSTSCDSDHKRKLSACASTSSTVDFLRIDSGSNDLASGSGFLSNARVGISSAAESGSSTLLNAEITRLDAAGAVTPISDGEREPPKMARKTVDDVWREIVAGKKCEKKPKEEMMTLEDFLAKAGEDEEDANADAEVDEDAKIRSVEVKEEGLSGRFYSFESGSGVIGGALSGGLDVGGLSRGRGRRSLSLLEPMDKAAQQRQRRMIKNRESAARSRERKQAYQVELETMAVRLEEEKEQLLKEKAERTKKRLKQLMEDVIPVAEKRRPRRLQKVRSI
ncbi:G-box-binding factor 4-like [Salvia splendens]|uniref:G-box-binding factor 4-like n=1 Tax=Salvia splendens TaxID=180675 RepID=UPI001C25DC00|nr:G-box-binding factor 4-like [Salvia splendens]